MTIQDFEIVEKFVIDNRDKMGKTHWLYLEVTTCWFYNNINTVFMEKQYANRCLIENERLHVIKLPKSFIQNPTKEAYDKQVDKLMLWYKKYQMKKKLSSIKNDF